jgi:hypothetical protein
VTQTRGALPQLTVKVESWPPVVLRASHAVRVFQSRERDAHTTDCRRVGGGCLKRTKHIPKKKARKNVCYMTCLLKNRLHDMERLLR